MVASDRVEDPRAVVVGGQQLEELTYYFRDLVLLLTIVGVKGQWQELLGHVHLLVVAAVVHLY